ncbi:hypothetical protein BKA70DRAFT_1438010 [Coprinopsis sp. MPI-PUGE-AT-0042]|nr:hypothetical protein BKA70DRAFT_1438010 [Coprinopsis sp. MPI-PUGE-AT-0042]
MVHVSTTVFVLAALSIVPAFAAPVALELEARDAQDLDVRSGQDKNININKNINKNENINISKNINKNENKNININKNINKNININKNLKRRSSEVPSFLDAVVRSYLIDQFDVEARSGVGSRNFFDMDDMYEAREIDELDYIN